MLAAFAVAGVVITGVFFVKYESDPLTARAGATGSVNTRQNIYDDTIGAFTGPVELFLGYGVEESRSDTGGSHENGRYIPKAGTHSTYLNYLFRTGLPGGLAIIALYGGAVTVARRASRSAPEGRRTLASLVTAAALIAAAHAVILSLYVEPVYTLTVSLLLGLAIATGMDSRGSLLPWRSIAS